MKKWVCFFCGNVHTGDAPPEVCPQCKMKLHASWFDEQKADRGDSNKMAFCTNCGAELESGVKFCTKCGTAVTGSQQAQTPVYTQPVTYSNPPPKFAPREEATVYNPPVYQQPEIIVKHETRYGEDIKTGMGRGFGETVGKALGIVVVIIAIIAILYFIGSM